MKRVEDSAAKVPERDRYKGQDCSSADSNVETVAKCAWGKPERSGEKPTWYLKLFH